MMVQWKSIISEDKGMKSYDLSKQRNEILWSQRTKDWNHSISQDKGRGGSRGGGNRNQGGDGDMVRVQLQHTRLCHDCFGARHGFSGGIVSVNIWITWNIQSGFVENQMCEYSRMDKDDWEIKSSNKLKYPEWGKRWWWTCWSRWSTLHWHLLSQVGGCTGAGGTGGDQDGDDCDVGNRDGKQ